MWNHMDREKEEEIALSPPNTPYAMKEIWAIAKLDVNKYKEQGCPGSHLQGNSLRKHTCNCRSFGPLSQHLPSFILSTNIC